MKVKLSNCILMAVLQAKLAVCKEIIDEVKQFAIRYHYENV